MTSAIQWRRWGPVVAVVVAVLAVVIWITAKGEEQPRARQYKAFTSCLLTDDRGVAGDLAVQVWSGMQDASLATRTKVEYLSVIGPQTADNAGTYLASLAQFHCDLVFLAGAAPTSAALAGAARFPDQRFIAVGDRPAEGRPNVTWLGGSSQDVRRAVSSAIREAAGRD
ncbi:BMP family ABC transporter substrate-binding protein [Micromonospora robiginosa]|uniref:Uncharacterized protein n=1 Tax=Micromonospora robiginosa TaxID=2749844 RepID=A0A7L6B056_9ACTN|nr:BMP family ABC transporter substrate-binding protein [Micromonospora ferruginea]QLQ35327.1 hypothetical protein H1D33_18205 [Micromonospora ferruginea]